MPYHLRSRDAVGCILGYDTTMMTVDFPMIGWLHSSGISGWRIYSGCLATFLPGERTPRCALATSNIIYL